MPAICQKSIDEVKVLLGTIGIKYSIKMEFSDSVLEGDLISQSISTGEKIDTETVVILTYSKGIRALDGWITDSSWKDSDYYSCESKTQYLKKIRNATEETSDGSESTKVGWEQNGKTEIWSNYSDWGVWTMNAIVVNDATQVDTRQVQDSPEYTVYHYYFYRKPDGTMYSFQNYEGWTRYETSSTVPFTHNKTVFGRDAYTAPEYIKFSNELWFLDRTETVPAVSHTEYRSRTRTKSVTYHFKRTVYGNWTEGEWVDIKPEESDTVKEAGTRTVYKYTEK